MINPYPIIEAIRIAEHQTINHARNAAIRFSSGKYKAAQLAKMGHPYHVRNKGVTKVGKNKKLVLAVPYGDPAIINIQSGTFVRNWDYSRPSFSNDTITSVLSNDTSYANKLAEGIDDLTIPRPLISKLIPLVDHWRVVNLTRGIRNGIQSINKNP